MITSDLAFWIFLKNFPDKNLFGRACSTYEQIRRHSYHRLALYTILALSLYRVLFFFSMDLRFNSRIVTTIVFLSDADTRLAPLAPSV